jgi:hypothetical protein
MIDYDSAPVSNYQRQVEFRARNPGYYGRLHRKRKAQRLALREAKRREQFIAKLFPKLPLMLPAPVETIDLFSMLPIRQRERVER